MTVLGMCAAILYNAKTPFILAPNPNPTLFYPGLPCSTTNVSWRYQLGYVERVFNLRTQLPCQAHFVPKDIERAFL